MKKIPVTTTIDSEFKCWLDENNITLAEWIKTQFIGNHDQATIHDLRRRLLFFAEKVVELQSKLDKMALKVQNFEKNRNPMFKDNKHGGVV